MILTSVLVLRESHAEEPGGLQSIGSQRVGHDDWSDLACSMHAGTQWLINCPQSLSLKSHKQDKTSVGWIGQFCLVSLNCNWWLWKGCFTLIKWTIGEPASKHPLKQESKYFTYYYVMQLVEKHQNNNTVTIKGQCRQKPHSEHPGWMAFICGHRSS